jgi:hypothetical protein
MGVEKCGEFPDKFFGSSLYSKIKDSMNWSEFAMLLSDMCNVSEPFTRHVLLSTSYKEIHDHLAVSKHSDLSELWLVLSFLKHCSDVIPQGLVSFPFHFFPPVRNEDIFKQWVSRMCEVIHILPTLILRGPELESELRSSFDLILARVCSELSTAQNVMLVRFILKFLIAMTSSKLIIRSEADKHMILLRVGRCLRFSNDFVDVGVCELLSNLLSCQLVTLSDLRITFVCDFIMGFLFGSAQKKWSIRRLVHNILVLSDEWSLKAVFSEVLLRGYFATFIDEETVRVGPISDSLLTLVQMAGNSGMDVCEIEALLGASGAMIGVLPSLSLLDPVDEYDPCIDSLEYFDRKSMTEEYFPETYSRSVLTSTLINLSVPVLVVRQMEPLGIVTERLSCSVLIQRISLILSMVDKVNGWEETCVWSRPSDSCVVHVGGYEMVYDRIMNFCLNNRLSREYSLMRYSHGTGKVAFLAQLIGRWFGRWRWGSELDEWDDRVKTVLMEFYEEREGVETLGWIPKSEG